MNNVKYPNFIIRTVNSNITIDNFYKQDYNVYSIDNMYMFTIYRIFISKSVAERLCSGNPKECIAAIKSYLKEVKYHIDDINNIISSQIPTLGNFNNYNELIEFLKENYQNPVYRNVLFQGDVVNINVYGTPMNASEFIPVSEDSIEYFIVGGVNEVTNTFVLVISANNTDYPDEAYGIELPAYVREEIIAILKGE